MGFPLIFLKVPTLDKNGNPASGGTITVRDENTSTKATIYTDAALTTQSANPLTLNASGYPPNAIFLADDNAYKIEVVDVNGASIDTQDNVRAASV